jgi:hypothetical protein
MKHDSGRSIVELMGYLAIVMVIGAGMFRMYGVYNSKIKRTAASAQISSLAEGARHATYGRKNVLGSLTARLALQGRKTLDPWGRPIEVANGAKCIEITFQRMSRADCIYLSRTIAGDCKEHVVSVNDADQTKGAEVLVGECNRPENTVRWFFSK